MHYTQQRIEFTKEFIGKKIEDCETMIKTYSSFNIQYIFAWDKDQVAFNISKAKEELEYWKDFYSHFV